MSDDFHTRLKEVMQMRGMTATDLVMLTGISKSRLSHYINGRHIPNSEGLVRLAKALGVNEYYLMGTNDEPANASASNTKFVTWDKLYNAPDLSAETSFYDQLTAKHGRRASKLLNSFGELNEKGQIRAVGLVDDLAEIPKYQKTPTTQTKSMPIFDDPAAAGCPIYAESSFTYVEYPSEQIPASADFGVRISGKSMEPTIENGTIVWVEKTSELCNNDVGVFMLDGGDAVCKRVKLNDNDRVIALLSDNPDYPSIIGSDLQGLRVVGRVLL